MMSTEPLMNGWTVCVARKIELTMHATRTLVQLARHNIKFEEILTVHCTFTVFTSIHRNYYHITRRHYESMILEFIRVRIIFSKLHFTVVNNEKHAMHIGGEIYQQCWLVEESTANQNTCSIYDREILLQYLISGREVQLIFLHSVKVWEKLCFDCIVLPVNRSCLRQGRFWWRWMVASILNML